MKHLLALLGFLLASASSCLAQGVTVELSFDQEQYLQHEPLFAKVRVTNFSGKELQLGKESDWIKFSAEGRDKKIVRKLENPDVKGEFTLESAKMATRRVDLAPYMEFDGPGYYQVTATVQVGTWTQILNSNPATVQIIPGIKIWEQNFGVPNTTEGENGVPEVRKYSLVQANSLKEVRLYVRVSDPSENKFYKVFPISRFVNYSSPQSQLDKFSNLHILNQNGARSFNYTVVNPDGLVITRETHDYQDSRPTLRLLEDGRITVKGGIRRPNSNDLPPSSLTSAEPSDSGSELAR